MKKKEPEQLLKEHSISIIDEVENWKHINEKGCNDPFWQDGCNMNLVRNHIIYYKREISRICEAEGLTLPDEYYIPTPPEVDNNYMATLQRKERVKRIREMESKISTKRNSYDEEQMSLF